MPEVAQAVARHAIRIGREVLFSNRRGPAALQGLLDELGPYAQADTPVKAAQQDIVLLAVMWTDIPAAITATGVTDWNGRIVIDATNQFLGPGAPADLGDVTGSEHVASLLPGAQVVKAFNTLFVRYIAADPVLEDGRQLLFLAGDDPQAKQTVEALVTEFGVAAVDAGALRDAAASCSWAGRPRPCTHFLDKTNPQAREEESPQLPEAGA